MFDWKHFYALAEFLHQNSNDLDEVDREAAFRTAISRAYYAAFHTARRYAENKSLVFDDGDYGSHKRLIETFRQNGQPNNDYGYIANKLDRMRVDRVSADYKPRFTANQKPSYVAYRTIKSTKDIISSIGKIEDQSS